MTGAVVRNTITGFLLTAIFWGCGVSVKVLERDEKNVYPYRTPPEAIQVLIDSPDTAMTGVALLSTEYSFYAPKTMNKLRQLASEMGGDAIILLHVWDEREIGKVLAVRYKP